MANSAEASSSEDEEFRIKRNKKVKKEINELKKLTKNNPITSVKVRVGPM